MCGIVGYCGKVRSPTKEVLNGLEKLEYRGYDSAGYATQDNVGIRIKKTIRGVSSLVESYDKSNEIDPVVSIGHTRWATHGKVSVTNAHPHKAGPIYLVHNGVIDNCDEIKQELGDVELKSETDSELIAQLINKYYQHDTTLLEAVRCATEKLHGTYGLAVISAELQGTIVVAKMGSPLIVGLGEKECWVASDKNALLSNTNRFIYLEDGEIASIIDGRFVSGKKTPPTIEKDEVSEYEIPSKGAFDHYMLKEIWEQPKAIKRCFAGRIRTNNCILGGFNLSPKELSSIENIVILACGTSRYAAMVGALLIERFGDVPCRVELASEFSRKKIVYGPNTIFIAISQSGETYDVIESVNELQLKGWPVFGIINTVGSTIARKCGAGTYIHAGPELSVASTKAFTSQLAALSMFACMLGRSKNLTQEQGAKFCSELRRVSSKVDGILDYYTKYAENTIKEVANYIVEKNYCMFLGSGLDYPVALEGSLKLKELAYIPCDGYATGEMKHGPLAIIQEGTPVICLSQPGAQAKAQTAIKEVAARGAKIITVSPYGERENLESEWKLVTPSNFCSFTSPFLSIVPLQLIAYHAAVIKGNNVDRPRNLAKSCTVN